MSDDVYRETARAALAVNHEGEPGTYAVTTLAHDPAHRATVDAALAHRAPVDLDVYEGAARAWLAAEPRDLVAEDDDVAWPYWHDLNPPSPGFRAAIDYAVVSGRDVGAEGAQ